MLTKEFQKIKKMSVEESQKDLISYCAAIECYENLELLFHQEHVDFSRVRHELHNCYAKIETIIMGEDTNCPFFVDLFQLKEHTSNLIKVMDTKMKMTHLNTSNPNKPDVKIKSQQMKKHDAEKLLNFVEGTIETPRINGLKEIAGLDDIKKELTSLVVLPRSQPQLFLNRKACNSVLLFGPPGTGKTHLVHALAHEAGARLHSISIGNVISPFAGESEKNIHFLFEYIRNSNIFSMLFIDEVDGFCRRRTDSEHEHSRRVKTELMCTLSRVEECSNMFLVCATNCPWDLDNAFLRRFQKRIYVPLPNSAERYDLFKLFLNNIPLEMSAEQWEHILDRTKGFSGSDISDLVQQALNKPIVELQDTIIWKIGQNNTYEPVTNTDDFDLENITHKKLSDLPPGSVRVRPVQPADLMNSLENITLTVTKEDIRRYEVFVSK